MKLHILSDLHLASSKFTHEDVDADVLVLAGDLAELYHLDKIKGFFAAVHDKYEHILYVLGNHEFYRGDINTTATVLKDAVAKYDNIYVLDNEAIVLDDTKFIGSTLWTDMLQSNELAKLQVGAALYDYRSVRNGTRPLLQKDTIELNRIAREYLEDELANSTNSVIITHHVPDMHFSHPRFAGDFVSYGFANTELMRLVEVYKPKLWVFGHTHDAYDEILYNTRFVCNPRGYYPDGEQPGYSQTKVVTI